MPNDSTLHIAYIGRLVEEKGILIVIDCIKRSITEKRNIIWHICWDGEYMEIFQKINHPWVLIYWYVDTAQLTAILDETDIVFMPSLFLETFWLVALETLSFGVPVCWFSRGWLQDFIHPSLAINPESPVDSFFLIVDKRDFPVVDVSNYSYDLWLERLKELTKWAKKILLVNDYTHTVGWAEEYIKGLQDALIIIWKDIELFWYRWSVHRGIRILLMLCTPFAFWRGISIYRKINIFQPDIIWMHSILRYIGPYWLSVISNVESKKYITHHDLGLITPRPSKIYTESDIPVSPNLGDWIPKKIHIWLIMSVLFKWITITWMWVSLRKTNIVHILPSKWMSPHIKKYIDTTPYIFPHTSKRNNSVK